MLQMLLIRACCCHVLQDDANLIVVNKCSIMCVVHTPRVRRSHHCSRLALLQHLNYVAVIYTFD
jgi:23S rRNA-/tRNA-specific pseudouridylate synthase